MSSRPISARPDAPVKGSAEATIPKPSASPAISEPSPEVAVCPMVVLDEPLELQEISRESQARADAESPPELPEELLREQPSEAPLPLPEVAAGAELPPANPPQANQVATAVASSTAVAKSEAWKNEPTIIVADDAASSTAVAKSEAWKNEPTIIVAEDAAIASEVAKSLPASSSKLETSRTSSSKLETSRTSSSRLEKIRDSGRASFPDEIVSQPRDSGTLSLETSYAVEFFSAPPPSTHVELEIDHPTLHDPVPVRTPQQVARQQYLRRVVLKGMLVLLAFVVVVFYLMWRRGLLHVMP